MPIMENSKVRFVKKSTKLLFAQILLVVVGAVPLQATAADSPFWKPCTKLGSKSNYSVSGAKGVLTCKKRGPFDGEVKGKWTMYWTEAGSTSAGPKVLTTTTTTTVPTTNPLISNLIYSTTIRPGTLLTVAFTVTSIIGINKDASGIVTFMHEGGGGSFGKIFSEWSNNFCVRTSELSLNCEGAIQFSETATAGTYRMNIIGLRNANNVSVNFNQSGALTVAP